MEDCVFCKIVRKEIPADIIFENNDYLVFKDINAKAPVHVLVIPKEHIGKDLSMTTNTKMWKELFEVVYKVITQTGLDKTGYRLAINGAGYNHVHHEHVHVLGGTNWAPSDGL